MKNQKITLKLSHCDIAALLSCIQLMIGEIPNIDLDDERDVSGAIEKTFKLAFNLEGEHLSEIKKLDMVSAFLKHLINVRDLLGDIARDSVKFLEEETH